MDKEQEADMPVRLSRTVIYESDYICLYTDRVRLPGGDIIGKYHQLHYPRESVAVVLFNERGQVLLMQNRRYTVGRLEWETVAGRIEPGESPEEAAARECAEESGCTVRELTQLCSQNPSNGMSDAVVHVFGAVVSAEGSLTDRDEIAGKRWFTREEVLELLRGNGTMDGVTILALLFALRFYRAGGENNDLSSC